MPLTKSTDSDDDSTYDPAVFQASLDDSFAAARQLVESWIPQGLGPEWDSQPGSSKTGEQAVQQLKEQARLPRLGLGASPSAYHAQQAQERKLARQLGLHKPSASSQADEGSELRARAVVNKPGGGVEGDMDESEDDEEESRAGAVKGKGKARPNGAGAPELSGGGVALNGKAGGKGKNKAAPQALNNPFVLNGTSTTTTSSSADSVAHPRSPTSPSASSNSKPLFNAPSPTKASPIKPSSSTTASSSSAAAPKPGLSTSSFYSSTPSSSKPDPFAGLSKNQRKKLRDRLKAEKGKREREEESRREAEEEEEAEGRGAKRARVEEEEKVEGGEEKAEETLPAEDAAESVSAPPSPTKTDGGDGEGGGEGGKKRKKKRRKSKGGVGAGEGGAEAAPLLNLGPLGRSQ